MKKYLLLFCIYFSGEVFAQLNNPAPFCVSNFSLASCENFIDGVVTTGAATNIVNSNNGCSIFADDYTYFCNKYAVVSAGQTLTINITKNFMYQCGIAAFVDWNGDNAFTVPAETIGATPGMVSISASFTFTVPPGQPNGKYRLRTRIKWLTNGTAISPCGTYDKGETEDYDIYVGTQPASNPSATITSNSPLCAGQNIVFNVNYSGTVVPTYSWSGPASFSSAVQNPSIVNSSTANAGNYTLSISGSTCPVVQSLPVNVYSYPTLTVNSPSICAGSTATLNANGANSYTWSFGSNAPQSTVSPSATTVYSLTGSNWGCNSTATTVVNVVPGISISQPSPMICAGDVSTITASGANTYSWSTGSNSPGIVVFPTVTTVYTVLATNGACQFSSTVTQTVVMCTGIDEKYSAKENLVFPNPFSEAIHIVAPVGTLMEIRNSLGQTIISKEVTFKEEILDTSGLPGGIYFLRLSISGFDENYKLVK